MSIIFFRILFMGPQTWADSEILDMSNSDIFLGKTLLSPYYVVLNYNAKFVTLEISGTKNLEYSRDFGYEKSRVGKGVQV